jgi:hypothetical protein
MIQSWSGKNCGQGKQYIENKTQAKISNNATFLVSMLEKASQTHIGILSVLSTIFVSGIRHPTQLKTATQGPPRGVKHEKNSCDNKSISTSTTTPYQIFGC